MGNFAVVIEYQFENEEQKSILLDTVDDTTINGSATVTSQPMVNGDEISDHMFREGKTLSLSGTCSMNGSQAMLLDTTTNKLQAFETLFERIQNEAILCNVYKISTTNKKDIRFLQRKNMVLRSFSYTEKINSLDFTFTFKQVLLSTIVELDVDTTDDNVPNPSEPLTTSFTNELINWNQVDAAIVKTIVDEKLCTQEFINYASSISKSQAVGGIAIAAGAGLAVGSLFVSNPIGLIVGAGALIFLGIRNLIKNYQEEKRLEQYKIQVFTYYEGNEAKNQQELERFSDFINSLHNAFQQIDSLFDVYHISQDGDQECMLSIGSEYYIFTFTKNNENEKYKLNVQNIDKTVNKIFVDLTASIEDFTQANSYNYLVKTRNNSRVYLIGPNEKDKTKLTDYFIVVCKFNPDDFNSLIQDIINTALFKDYKSFKAEEVSK